MIPRSRLRQARLLFFRLRVSGLALLVPSLWAQNTLARSDYQPSVTALRSEIIAEMKDKQLHALSIALIDDGQVVWSEGFGYEDGKGSRPATGHTIYRVGSVSKLFTDVAVMQMVEQGRLHLDSPITRVLPEFKPVNPFGGEITLRELMSHQSGLTREPPVGHYFDSTSPSLRDTVSSLNRTTLVFPPRTHFKYSNAGIAVVGYALERASGVPFADYVKRSVLQPLGMNDSAFTPEPRLLSHLAEGKMWTYDGLEFPAPTFQLGEAPAASMYTSVEDLSRFMIMATGEGLLGSRQILAPASLHEMFTPQYGGDYGLGFAVDSLDGHRMLGHGGEVYGFTTQLSFLPKEKLGVVIATNMDDVNAVTEHLADDALRFMLAKQGNTAPPAPVTRAPPTPDEARAAVGTYKGVERNLTLQEQNGRLMVSRSTGGNLAELKRKGSDFITDSRLSWWSMGVALHGDSLVARGETFSRLPNDLPPQAPQWNEFIGEYGWDYDKLFVFEDAGNLHILVEWFDYEPLQREGADTFVLPDRGFYQAEKVRFERDAQNRISGVWIGSVRFPRLPQTPENEIFRIHPLDSVAKLRQRAMRSHPPASSPTLRESDLVELTSLAVPIRLDIRYATNQNFLGTAVYTEARAFLQRPAAEALAKVAGHLQQRGYGLMVYDAYRPWSVTRLMWDATPKADRGFVADPARGSRHNRGCAVDLTLYDLATGTPVSMTGGYDEMTERSRPFYPGGTARQRWLRDLLRYSMEAEGFTVNDSEWWHFDYKDWPLYPIANVPFEQLRTVSHHP